MSSGININARNDVYTQTIGEQVTDKKAKTNETLRGTEGSRVELRGETSSKEGGKTV